MFKQKTLIITRGIPGCGKSTFVNTYLKTFTNIVESDKIRLDINGFDSNGKINQVDKKDIWYIIYQTIEKLLNENKNVTLDATNLTKWSIIKLKEIAFRTNARLIIINFSNISLETALQQNKNRLPSYKIVPENVIERMYKEMYKARNIKALDGLEIYTPITFLEKLQGENNDVLYSIQN